MSSPAPRVYSFNFVCMGNICRSPVAKGVFLHLAREHNISNRFIIDSCGVSGWHQGSPADPRSVQSAAVHGVMFEHAARKVRANDFTTFDLLLAMDLANVSELIRQGAPPVKVRLLRSFDPALDGLPDESLQVPDPYYGGDGGFEEVFQMLWRANTGLINSVKDGSLDAQLPPLTS
jgi:protein-tyrosine phosphatase